ncbi:MAG: NTP transferase domain-containing protein [Pseudonocardia sp.]|nr:NTP transferase domain-containing protein [Pseudonocardia sp.]
MTGSAGLLLAAGAGRRMGRPKALVDLGGVPLARRALAALRDGGCGPLFVVLGAAADQVAALLPPDAHPVHAADWSRGMGASLRAGLAALAAAEPPPVAAVVHLVDLPGVGAPAIARLVLAATGPDALARTVYGGVPGHPVLLGRSHWAAVARRATGDSGARGYLADHAGLALVECADVADPRDVDTPDSLRAFATRLPG